MTSEEQIREAMANIRHNLPGIPTTRTSCAKCGSGRSRGGKDCLNCCTEILAGLTTRELAEDYVSAILRLNQISHQLYEFDTD